MTFQTFHEFAEWCIDIEQVNVLEYDENNSVIIIGDLWDTPGMIVCEVLVSAYDSRFVFGPMDSDLDNGSIVLHSD